MLMMTERMKTLGQMEQSGLALKLTADYTEQQINACCDHLEDGALDKNVYQNCFSIQAALITVPGFSERLRFLLGNGVSAYQVEQWLSTANETGCRIMDYSAQELIYLFSMRLTDMRGKQEFARYYLHRGWSEQALQAAADNVFACYQELEGGLAALPEEERALFSHPCLEAYINGAAFSEVLPRLAAHPICLSLLDAWCASGIELSLDEADWTSLYALTVGMKEKLEKIHSILGTDGDRTGIFIRYWLDNGALAEELEAFIRWTRNRTMEEIDAALNNYLAYLNALYGSFGSGIPFREVHGGAFQLLAYALTHKQKAFLRLIEENFPLYQSISDSSMLFYQDFYSRTRLNALTLKNLAECQKIIGGKKNGRSLNRLSRRMFTFDELKTLFQAEECYARLYDLLDIPRTDDRLLTIRQLLKHDLLDEEMNEDQISQLARRLSAKNLMDWRDQEFAHIKGLTLLLCVRILSVYDQVERFLPDIRTSDEADFMLRQHEALKAYTAWADVLKDIQRLDRDWAALREALQLDGDFTREHEQEIISFLCKEGAAIAMDYSRGLDDPKGFYRIVRALLMGQYEQVKYHSDDLQRELSFPITEQQKRRWMENTEITQGKIHVEERDDFFSTMRIGQIPQRTCLNYKDGAYRHCLLACFDSNKKIIYATMGGRPVARAMLRLTKGSFTAPGGRAVKSLEFADVLHPDAVEPEKKSEELAVFLERLYTNGIDDLAKKTVQKLFAEQAAEKAKEMGARVVLSHDYRPVAADMDFTAMNYYLYISKSKAGEQYLDSLGGSQGASKEGSYYNNVFMLQAA